ncbi:hypothetical protein [Sphingomonas sp. CLY1604]|uniref:hypothetical protein n=1 Tax=Sphingomonas sp. CLY1604 TaxID=3457786 RepID=UPI003FD6F8F8
MTGTLRLIPEEIVLEMRRLSVPKTDEGLQQVFGISYNTWRRIDRHQPIRSSVAERLIERMDRSFPARCEVDDRS